MNSVRAVGYGLLDNVAGLQLKISSKKMFAEGMGGEEWKNLFDKALEQGAEGFDDIEVDLREKDDQMFEDVTVFEGTFESPAHEYLHYDHMKQAKIEMIVPTDIDKPKGVVILFPMTGDLGLSYRRKNLALPLAKEGYASVSLLIANYKSRMPPGQVEGFIRTCNEYAISCQTTFLEGAKLIKWARSYFDNIPVAVSGLSLGGISSCGALTYDDGDLIVVPAVIGNGAKELFLDGVLKNIWTNKAFDTPEKEEEFDSFLDELKVSNLIQQSIDRGMDFSKRRIIIRHLYAKGDKAVPKVSAKAAMKALGEIATQYTAIPVIGGHISTIMNGKANVVPEIIKAFDEYNNLAKKL